MWLYYVLVALIYLRPCGPILMLCVLFQLERFFQFAGAEPNRAADRAGTTRVNEAPPKRLPDGQGTPSHE